jgi:hypothetical protein
MAYGLFAKEEHFPMIPIIAPMIVPFNIGHKEK